MASDDPPHKPKERSQRREQTNRIAAISHRIAEIGPQLSAPIRELVRELGNQFVALIKQIDADNKTADTREKENQDRSFRWVKIGTCASIVLSVGSLAASIFGLIVLKNQLSTMRIEQRAWIKIDHRFNPVVEGNPLDAEITIKNIGKTPAKQIEAFFKVHKLNKNIAPDMKMAGRFSTVFIGMLNTDVPAPYMVAMTGDVGDPLKPPPLTAKDVAELQSGEAYIVIFGDLTYFDVYGTPHWIHFCAWNALKPKIYYMSRNCVQYNDVDDN